MQFFELNIDGLVGPTHHYAGLSQGNLASISHKGITAQPKTAALQGLKKMRFLHQLGLKQAVLPPQQRPNLGLLQQLGFHGHWPGKGREWVNVADEGDVVALVKDLRVGFGQGVECWIVENGASAHDVRPYLTAVETGQAVWKGLCARD